MAKINRKRSWTRKELLESYLALREDFRLRPVRTDEEADRATDVAESLWLRLACRQQLNPAERIYLDVVKDLIDAYEDSGED